MAQSSYQRRFLLRPILTCSTQESSRTPCSSRTVRLRCVVAAPNNADNIVEYWQRWIVNDRWTYTADLTPFVQSVPQNSSQHTLLVFYGLDTIANIVGIFNSGSTKVLT